MSKKDLHIQLDDELFKELRVHCASRGLRLNEFVAEAIFKKLEYPKPIIFRPDPSIPKPPEEDTLHPDEGGRDYTATEMKHVPAPKPRKRDPLDQTPEYDD
jgi:hypothetical protein